MQRHSVCVYVCVLYVNVNVLLSKRHKNECRPAVALHWRLIDLNVFHKTSTQTLPEPNNDSRLACWSQNSIFTETVNQSINVVQYSKLLGRYLKETWLVVIQSDGISTDDVMTLWCDRGAHGRGLYWRASLMAVCGGAGNSSFSQSVSFSVKCWAISLGSVYSPAGTFCKNTTMWRVWHWITGQ